ncbi:hypothetical protein BU16DRAFT_563461 [Lophium mytilinum]|uniref:DUF7932 domain-containing protein n=1 Tax=Lophium mytilinum TaxID=390894 RepID=A0A6A6QLE5_9PEZI|nr:hypothetical protein BU16DRAFT_563461 [Lophium mytilinum]
MLPATYLSGGQSGRTGSSQVRVIKRDLTEATCPKRYMLKVVSFDVVDENEDTINEPGEHIYIRNLIVENFGGMPSPKYNPIKIAVHGSDWLEPVTATFLPEEIQVGARVKVPGEIKALIKNETAKRAPSSDLFINHEVSLIASFERLERALPEFHVGGGAPIQIQYPLQLSPPRHLDCVAKGDNVRFLWTLKNISTKPYGVQTQHGRYAATRLTDPDSVFNLKYASGESSADDVIDELLPGAEVPIDQDLMVSSSAMEYSDSVLTLDLMLSDPSKVQKGTPSVLSARSVMTHFFKMQISGKYQYNPRSRCLLVVNSGTPNKAIHQIIKFIRTGLQLEVDIYNISLTGSFTDPETSTDVLSRYEGKSIIVYGSSLPYFRAGNRNPWDFMDAWEVCRLAKAGTNFLFASAADSNSLHQWGSVLAFPTLSTAMPSNINAENLASLLENLKLGKLAPDNAHTYHKFTVKMNPAFGCFSNLESTLLKNSHAAANKLNKTYPLRRFVARPDLITDKRKSSGSVIVSEGLSKSANILVSKLPHPELEWITEYHMYTVVSCLPFSDQARIFWNLVGQWDKQGLPSTTVYNGLPHLLESRPIDHPVYAINERVFTAICMSIESKISTEITRYCDKPSWPSPISATEVLAHLPHLSQLFSTTPLSTLLSSTDRSEFLVSTLGTISGALQPIGFSQGWNNIFGIKIRKKQVRSQATQSMNLALSRVFAPAALSAIQKSIQAAAKRTKQAIKKSKQPDNSLNLVLRSKFDAFTNTTGAVPDDLTEGTPANYTLSKGWSRDELLAHRQTHAGRLNKIVADAAHSKSVIAEHLNPEDEDEDEGDVWRTDVVTPTQTGAAYHEKAQQAFVEQAIAQSSTMLSPTSPVEMPTPSFSPVSPATPAEMPSYGPDKISTVVTVAPAELPAAQNEKLAALPVVMAVELQAD